MYTGENTELLRELLCVDSQLTKNKQGNTSDRGLLVRQIINYINNAKQQSHSTSKFDNVIFVILQKTQLFKILIKPVKIYHDQLYED